MLEQKRDGAIGAEVAAIFVERVAHFGDRALCVVGQTIHDDGGTVNAVAFVANLFVVNALKLSGAALHRALDGLFGEVIVVGFIDGQSQSRVALKTAAAHFGGNGYFLDEARGNLAFFGILSPLAVLDICPLTVTGHNFSVRSLRTCVN